MPSLDSKLRKDLENVVKQARRAAETGASKALDLLAVGQHEPWSSLKPEQRRLRNRLRAHGVQLGDLREEKRGTQTITRLAGEVAYEHWHRMLFARYLAENELLIESESGQPMSLDECRELAREQGKDWLPLACGYAEAMLPEIFRRGDPVLEVMLPPETRSELEEMLNDLPRDVFVASDSLGWVYQFWQADRKDEVNASGDKIGADQLPSVTQLFTEDYMVDFLLDNTLGAWWAGKQLAINPRLSSLNSETEVREAVALPDCTWRYLRFIKSSEGRWTPAAGTFPGWPKLASAIRALDPCMGSGHFVVAMFERLVALRVAEEKFDQGVAIAAVIRDNLFGLEVDPRCTQIAAFNLALAAWRRVGYRVLPAMNLACSGSAPNASEADWLKIAGGDGNIQNGMSRLYRLFKNAPVLGSLINPRIAENELLESSFRELQPLLEQALAKEAKDETAQEMAVAARGIAKAAEILAGQFTLVATNVPYLGRGKQDDILMDFCERVYPEAKTDLATCFVERCLDFCALNSSTALVTPQNWLFLGSYQKLRETLLSKVNWDFVSRLGPKGFQTPMWDFNIMLIGLSRVRPEREHKFAGLDVAQAPGPELKVEGLLNENVAMVGQLSQLKNPDSRVVQREGGVGADLLSKRAEAFQGLITGDRNSFIFRFWEIPRLTDAWEVFVDGFSGEGIPLGRENIILWERGNGRLYQLAEVNRDRLHDMHESGNLSWGKKGILLTRIGLRATPYYGERYDNNLICIIPSKAADLAALWNFCSSTEYRDAVRELDQKLSLTNATACKVGVDLDAWRDRGGLPAPVSSDPTQWLFNGNPVGSDQPLHVAVARLLGYHWPRQAGSSFPDCPALGTDALDHLSDKDGIVCLSANKGEAPAVDRLNTLLAAAFGSNWSSAKARELVAATDSTAKSLADWLSDDFFVQHCDLFHQRPFIWHVWDGLKGGFGALINYHRLGAGDGAGKRTLEKLIYTYLGEWIDVQRKAQKAGVEGADARLTAAEHLSIQLKAILAGEPPFDLFVRWKPLHEQAVGWNPDINDGVRLNIRPWITAKPLNGRGKNACILRATPKVGWDKDRGKEPQRAKVDFPWFWTWDEMTVDFKGGSTFDGNRWNDCHYTIAAKETARELSRKTKR